MQAVVEVRLCSHKVAVQRLKIFEDMVLARRNSRIIPNYWEDGAHYLRFISALLVLLLKAFKILLLGKEGGFKGSSPLR